MQLDAPRPRSRRLSTGLLTSAGAFPSHANLTEIPFEGLVDRGSPQHGRGAVAHDELPIEVAVPFDADGRPTRDVHGRIAHPMAAMGLESVYTRLTSPGLFDFQTGAERATETLHEPMGAFSGTSAALARFGITGRLELAFAGFTLDVDAPTDYRFEATRIDAGPLTGALRFEHRVYRHGELIVAERRTGGTLTPIVRYVDATCHLIVDWQAVSLGERGVVRLTVTGEAASGCALPLRGVFRAVSNDPIDVHGYQPERYGRYDITDGILTLDTDIGLASASADFVDFGLVPMGGRPIEHITVANVGTGPLTLLGVSVVGDAADAFDAVAPSLLSTTLGPDETMPIALVFRSISPGVATATVAIETDDRVWPVLYVGVRATAAVEPAKTLDPTRAGDCSN
jgi:hypothetical protein